MKKYKGHRKAKTMWKNEGFIPPFFKAHHKVRMTIGTGMWIEQ